MKINVEETSSVERKLNVEIPWDQVKEEIDRALVQIQKRADLKGFRKGKAPMEMVRQVFAEDARQEAVNNLVSVATRKALDENNLDPLGNPYLTDVKSEDEEPLIFEAMVELMPEFELADYEGLKLEKPVSKVTEKEVSHFIDSMRERRAEAVPVFEDRTLKGDDVAEIDFKGSRGGEPVAGMDVSNYIVRLGRSELLPGFEEQIVGMKPDQNRTFDLPFPEEFPNQELAGQTVSFEVTLKQIKELKLPDLDDEFAKSVSEHETVKDLTDMIRQDLEKLREEESEKALKGNLSAKLVEDNQFDVPPSLVDSELRYLIQEYGENLVRSGMPSEKVKDVILEHEDHMKTTAADHVRLVYVINNIADAEKIQATREQVEDLIREAALRTGKDFDDLQKKYTEDGTIRDVAFGIVREEVFKLLIGKADIKEVKVKPEGETESKKDKVKPKKKAAKKKKG
ncbi:MAG: trigger factor [bacterium]